jgi:hypothetical protein
MIPSEITLDKLCDMNDISTIDQNHEVDDMKQEALPASSIRKAKALSNNRHSVGSQRNTELLLSELFRCPDIDAEFALAGDLSSKEGYFRFGPDAICYGRCTSGVPAETPMEPLLDAREHVVANGSSVQLPFDPVQVIDNLRCERYATNSHGSAFPNQVLSTIYYAVRPAMTVSVRKHLQRLYLRGREKHPFPRWPVDFTVETLFEQLLVLAMQSQNLNRLPFIWFWPDGVSSCTTISHDVETGVGLEFCPQLMDLDDSFGVKSSFPIIPEERYKVSDSTLECIRNRGFEINVHDLNHDGHLFSNHERFLRRAKRINEYAQQFRASGFRSGAMYRNVDWFDALDFSYDMSIPNVAHLDPQKGGCCTVLPFFIGNIVELPVTTTQDYSLFHILRDYSTRLWKQQISRIREKHGLISVIVHPDYIIERSARHVYTELLEYLCDIRSKGETWIALPGEVASWWRLRSELRLVPEGPSWRIEGNGSERARLAYAKLSEGQLTFEVDNSNCEVSTSVKTR